MQARDSTSSEIQALFLLLLLLLSLLAVVVVVVDDDDDVVVVVDSCSDDMKQTAQAITTTTTMPTITTTMTIIRNGDLNQDGGGTEPHGHGTGGARTCQEMTQAKVQVVPQTLLGNPASCLPRFGKR